MFTASMRFDLGEDIHALQTLVHRFAQDQIKPLAGDVDRDNQFPVQLWKQLGDLGVLGVTVDEEFGGVGLGIPPTFRPPEHHFHGECVSAMFVFRPCTPMPSPLTRLLWIGGK